MGLFGKIRSAMTIFILVIISGTIGFRILEPDVTSYLDSFYFTLITVTTVGFGDIVPYTVAGKILAITIILTGAGSAISAIQGTFEVLVGKRIKEELNLPQKIIKIEDHSIICGYSMVGKSIIRKLQKIGRKFVVIEWNKEKIHRMVEAKIPVIEGDAREETVLERAGIREAISLMAALDDASNVFVALTAKFINPNITIVSKVEDLARNAFKLERAGVDQVIACHDVGARMMIETVNLLQENGDG